MVSKEKERSSEWVPDESNEDLDLTNVNGNPRNVSYDPSEGGFLYENQTNVDHFGIGLGSSSLGQKSKVLDTSIQQEQYNRSRLALLEAINRSRKLLYELITENKERPVYYPVDVKDGMNHLLNSTKAHVGLVKNRQEITEKLYGKAKLDDEQIEKPEFRVLNFSLKLAHGGQGENNIMQSLDKSSLSALVDQTLNKQLNYLERLRERVNDTSSKVLVTGDLNAGKSTFCNTLLRRKLLPEDQQPCTAVFCEVIDAKKENNSMEEVHAIPIGSNYNIRDESTYLCHPLSDLENLVYECDKYKLLKIYVLDRRSFEDSLLCNGVIDIKLIDAPGLNMDLYQTTQIFSRQEEIDLVVFVVSSENHFTLSAKEFIATAAAEKRYVFIVANKFDHIRDKSKCKSKIMEQVKKLSPDTYKNSKEFVHFVNSNQHFDDGSGGDSDGDDDPNFADPDFDELERNLRKFVLEKRSISKLLPAKNYMRNLFNDMSLLAKLNYKVYVDEMTTKRKILDDAINPDFQEITNNRSKLNSEVQNLIEDTCTSMYNYTRNEVFVAIDNFGDKQIIPYMGISYLYEYAQETQRVMIESILSTVRNCEQYSKRYVSEKVEEIVKLGEHALHENYLKEKVFNADLMFTRKRDDVMKHIEDLIELSDFFDPSWNSFLCWIGFSQEFVDTSKNHLRFYNPMGLLSGIPKGALQLRNQVPTQLSLRTLYSSTKLLTTGALVKKLYSLSHLLESETVKKIGLLACIGITGLSICYLIDDIPNAFPRKQARKIKDKVLRLDYAHKNSERISKECRNVLAYPSRQLFNCFQTCIDKKLTDKNKIEKDIGDAKKSCVYFDNLLKKIADQQGSLDEINLELITSVD